MGIDLYGGTCCGVVIFIRGINSSICSGVRSTKLWSPFSKGKTHNCAQSEQRHQTHGKITSDAFSVPPKNNENFKNKPTKFGRGVMFDVQKKIFPKFPDVSSIPDFHVGPRKR